jgi:hypothetical protein
MDNYQEVRQLPFSAVAPALGLTCRYPPQIPDQRVFRLC